MSLEIFSLRKSAIVQCKMLRRAIFPTFNDFFIAALKAPGALSRPEGSRSEILFWGWEEETKRGVRF